MNQRYIDLPDDPRTLKRLASRDGFGAALLKLGELNPRVFVLTADLMESMKVDAFAQQFPLRFIECGVAEQNMMGIAAGLALSSKVPFVASYAVFSPGRNWDQLRVSVCYQRANVKIVGGHTGLATGPDGATHQALEDIAITRVLPNMTVVVPADAPQAEAATLALATHVGPSYLRLYREPSPVITTTLPFRLGKAQIVKEGSDATIVACGTMVYESLLAARMLESLRLSIRVVNLHTIKPIDTAALIACAQETGAVVTAEDHQIAGGMGSAVSEVLAANFPVPIEFVGVEDQFGQSGTPKELYQFYGLTAKNIVKAVKKSLTRKNKRGFVQ